MYWPRVNWCRCSLNDEKSCIHQLTYVTSGVRHSKPRSVSHSRVLPPGKFNDTFLEPLIRFICELANEQTWSQKHNKITNTNKQSGWPLSRQCEIPGQFAALGMLSVTHIMPAVLVLLSAVGVGMQQCMIWNHILYLTQNRLLLNTCMDANMQLTINSFRQLFPDKIFSVTFPFPDISLIFSEIPDISLTAVKFPDSCRCCRQVVTLNNTSPAAVWKT